jgi:hypothetical protein
MVIPQCKQIIGIVSVYILLFCNGLSVIAQSGAFKMPEYTISKGEIIITIDKSLIINLPDSTFSRYGLSDSDVISSIKKNDWSVFVNDGWQVKDKGKNEIILRKKLPQFVDFTGDDSKLLFSSMYMSEEKSGIPKMDGKIGVNSFKNLQGYQINDSICVFKLNGYQDSKDIYLSGSFNGWSTHELKMVKSALGWEARIKLYPGKYLYKFIVDGNWLSDDNNLLSESDGYAKKNSVFYMCNHVFQFKGDDDYNRVFLSGSFVDWQPKKLSMNKEGNGQFSLPVYLVNGTYTYKFVADKEWLFDKLNPNKVTDGNGGYNSVVSIGEPRDFQLEGYSNAKKVVLSGDFNNWLENELELTKNGNVWELSYVLAPGNYQYKYIVDGQWILDPANEDMIPNGVKSYNSFLVIDPNCEFTLSGHQNAKQVYLVGSFNSWSENSFLMKKNGNDWTFRLHLEPGKYTYKFLVDGKWKLDPKNKLWEENEFGTSNSILWVDR